MSDHTNCGPECGQHGQLIAGYSYLGRGVTAIHLTPEARRGLNVSSTRRPFIKTFWRKVWERLFG